MNKTLSIALIAAYVFATGEFCEKIDGDCPDDCIAAGFEGTINHSAKLSISPAKCYTEKMAWRAENYISKQGPVIEMDDPIDGLHTSIFYFCCHTQQESEGLKEALHDMKWRAFDIHYDTFGCNLDHNGTLIYMHAMPSEKD